MYYILRFAESGIKIIHKSSFLCRFDIDFRLELCQNNYINVNSAFFCKGAVKRLIVAKRKGRKVIEIRCSNCRSGTCGHLHRN